MRSVSARGWTAFGLASAAVAWSFLLLASAFFFPAYRGESCEGGQFGFEHCTSTSSTFIDENGTGAVVWLALPAVVAILGWLLLHHVCATGSKWGRNGALTLVVVLFAFGVFAASIGILVLPVTLMLATSALLVEPSPSIPKH